MELWLRYREAVNLEWDRKVTVSSRDEWYGFIYDPAVISSILWPVEPLFTIGGRFFNRRHHHEIDYINDPGRNRSYLEASRRTAERLNDTLGDRRCLVYAPLRGAYPIWRAISQFLDLKNVDVYYPVTSSFVFFPEEFNIVNKRGRRASGRYNNFFELERLRSFLKAYDCLVYVDEIVSGGMMRAHLKEMFKLGINQEVPVVAVGLADRFGERSVSKRRSIDSYVQQRRIEGFIWEGCTELITEDQKFLLGIHYDHYDLGPHVIPLLNDSFEYYEEKKLFDGEVFTGGPWNENVS